MNTSCPSCFLKFDVKASGLMCVSGRCPVVDDPAGSVFFGAPRQMTTLIERDEKAQPRPCPKCNGQQHAWVCPRCHVELPEFVRQSRVFTVALAGARGAGKTVYISALLESLRRYVGARGGILQPIGRTAAEYKDNYYDALFNQSRVLPPTQKGRREPLVWRVENGKVSTVLVLRDVAGEDLEQLDRTGPQASLSFLGDADLTVFLFDPYAVPRIMDSLAGLIPRRSAGAVGRPADEVLSNVLTQLHAGSRLALTVSKFDVIQRIASVTGRPSAAIMMRNMGAAFNRDESLRPPFQYDPHDSQDLDAELRALLNHFGGADVLRRATVTAERGGVRQMRTFAVSALGAAPGDNVLDEHGVSSFRCLDPLLWGLSEANTNV